MSLSILSELVLEIATQIISDSIGMKNLNIGERISEKTKDELDKNKVDYELLNKQIMLAQNLAIAQRIETADEVEIEEYYDTNKEATLGLKGNSDGATFGLNLNGKVIEKRVYKFKGYNDKRIETYEQTRNKVFNLKNSEEPNIEKIEP